jgi:hypothetical protein
MNAKVSTFEGIIPNVKVRKPTGIPAESSEGLGTFGSENAFVLCTVELFKAIPHLAVVEKANISGNQSLCNLLCALCLH